MGLASNSSTFDAFNAASADSIPFAILMNSRSPTALSMVGLYNQ